MKKIISLIVILTWTFNPVAFTEEASLQPPSPTGAVIAEKPINQQPQPQLPIKNPPASPSDILEASALSRVDTASSEDQEKAGRATEDANTVAEPNAGGRTPLSRSETDDPLLLVSTPANGTISSVVIRPQKFYRSALIALKPTDHFTIHKTTDLFVNGVLQRTLTEDVLITGYRVYELRVELSYLIFENGEWKISSRVENRRFVSFTDSNEANGVTVSLSNLAALAPTYGYFGIDTTELNTNPVAGTIVDTLNTTHIRITSLIATDGTSRPINFNFRASGILRVYAGAALTGTLLAATADVRSIVVAEIPSPPPSIPSTTNPITTTQPATGGQPVGEQTQPPPSRVPPIIQTSSRRRAAALGLEEIPMETAERASDSETASTLLARDLTPTLASEIPMRPASSESAATASLLPASAPANILSHFLSPSVDRTSSSPAAPALSNEMETTLAALPEPTPRTLAATSNTAERFTLQVEPDRAPQAATTSGGIPLTSPVSLLNARSALLDTQAIVRLLEDDPSLARFLFLPSDELNKLLKDPNLNASTRALLLRFYNSEENGNQPQGETLVPEAVKMDAKTMETMLRNQPLENTSLNKPAVAETPSQKNDSNSNQKEN